MLEEQLPYFKFVSALIDRGLWARMSSAARTLYPVLLRFSDRNFKPVFPGAQTLLRLTGFKQKASLRKARRELTALGLISVTEGSGRRNTFYHFRFDWAHEDTPQGATNATPSEAPGRLPAVHPEDPPGFPEHSPGGSDQDSRYNQIHISINNNVPQEGGHTEIPDSDRMEFLVRRFGADAVELARSECALAGAPADVRNLQKILYRNQGGHGDSWTELRKYLSGRISPGSLAEIEQAFREESRGVFVFSDNLPEHIKELLRRGCERVFFEPEATRGEFWQSAARGNPQSPGPV